MFVLKVTNSLIKQIRAAQKPIIQNLIANSKCSNLKPMKIMLNWFCLYNLNWSKAIFCVFLDDDIMFFKVRTKKLLS